MQTKLTLRIEKDLIEAAKKYSKKRGISVSQLFSDYLLIISKVDEPPEDLTPPLPPITQSLKGILSKKNVQEKSYKKYLEDKYK